jgi:tetratricopeptide (TPR) repeat protein
MIDDSNIAVAKEALLVIEKRLGPDDPKLANAMIHLATMLGDTGQLGEAERLIWRAIAIDEKHYGPDGLEVAKDIHVLFHILYAGGKHRFAEAEPLMRRALAIFEESNDQSYVATSLNNLGHLLTGSNRLQEAEPLMRRALALSIQTQGVDHPQTVGVRNALSDLVRKLEKAKKDSNRISLWARLTNMFRRTPL